ncbi:MAG: hypothetical protein J6Y53_05275 [Alphaproteobacteria bacterium]|nr:hypothetical protein [Alphaproteobacteria bacterium]
MKKTVLLLVAFVLMVAGAYAQTSSTATPKADSVKPKATVTNPAPTNIATSKEVEQAPDVVLAKDNCFTGEVLVIGTSKVFLTKKENIFVWMKDGKAVEIRMIRPEVFMTKIKSKGLQVHDMWPMILKIGREEFLVYYFATSGGGYYGLPDGSIKKEPHMKQSGVIRTGWLDEKWAVKDIKSLRKIIEEIEKSSSTGGGNFES